MNSEYRDAQGTVFVTDDTVGAEHSDSKTTNCINRVNFDVLMNDAKHAEKRILTLHNERLKDVNVSEYDVVAIGFGYGGKELYIRDAPENRELLDELESLESYPCLDDHLYAVYAQEMVNEAKLSGDFYFLTENNLSQFQKERIDDISYVFNQYVLLESCPFYKDGLFNKNEIVDKRLIIELLTDSIEWTLEELEEWKPNLEHEAKISENIDILTNWFQEQEQTFSPSL